MLDLHKQLAAAKTPHDKTTIERQIEATDQQIDRLVYELYGLTEDEIRIVEGASSPSAPSADTAALEVHREGTEQYRDAFKRPSDS